jgi:putative endonuclease
MVKFGYVYMLESLSNPDRYYVGFTENLKDRLTKHNGGEVRHSSKYGPWCIKTAIAFRDIDRAHDFERYLKTASGRAFAKKRF